tara:strand:+ start:157 stop:567 length:411 start_codon:yes stop_codon:yes gene_type:complete
MQLVVDMNILFSFFKKHSFTRKLLTNHHLTLYAPKYAFEEFQEHLDEIKSKSNINLSVYDLYKTILSWFVEFIPVSEYKEFADKASKISPDPEDTQYFALALKYGCPIWSNDRRMKNQTEVKIYTTREIVSLLSEN